MRLSGHFHALHDGYLAEIEDLRTDSEGRDVLQRRLRDKRDGFAAIAPMLDDPLLLAPALHGAFRLPPGRPPEIERLLRCEPDAFPTWDELGRTIEVEPWARALVARALEEPSGPAFLATVVGLEYLLARHLADAAGAAAAPPADDGGRVRGERGERDGEDGDDGLDDDGEALGEDFLERQGFDRRTEP